MKALVAVVLSVCSAVAYSEVDPSKLPQDLSSLAQSFNHLVVPAAQQDEYEFKMSRVSLDGDAESANREILKREAQALIARPGAEVHRFSVVDLFNAAGEEKQIDALVAELFSEFSPGYFCLLFKDSSSSNRAPSDAVLTRRCKAKTYALFASVAGHTPLKAYLAVVEGNNWGPWKHVTLYVQSSDDRSVALKFVFDVIHEI